MVTNITTLLEYRDERLSDNNFLFARPGNGANPYRGSDCLRNFAHQCGAKAPQNMTSTKLRKQLATLAQILNLKENSMDLLATFQV